MSEEAALEAAALGLLATREHSRAELARKLGKKVDSELVQAVLDGLATRGLQSDTRYAQSLIRSRLAKGQGPLVIQRDLKQSGIETWLIDQAMEEAAPDWAALLQQVAGRKFGPEPVADYKEAAKRARFLAQRGFESEMIRRLLSRDGFSSF